jgi:hypothetical protein
MIETMRVLTTRGGELATVAGPICSWSDCPCWKHGVGLESGYPVDDGLVVAERDGFTLGDLKAACAAFLERKGWDWTDIDELAEMMSDEAAEIAEQCEPGTRLWPEFNGESEQWDWFDEPPEYWECIDEPPGPVDAGVDVKPASPRQAR